MSSSNLSEEDVKAMYDAEYKYHYDKGIALCELAKYEEAVVSYKECVALNPSFGWAYGNMALALYSAGRYQRALEAIEKALSLAPNDQDFTATRQDILREIRKWKSTTPSPEELTQKLFAAINSFDLRSAIQLIEWGADANGRDLMGNAPIHYCYMCKCLLTCKDFAKVLVENGADVNARNLNGDTPWVKLHGIKAREHKAALCSFLEELGAVPDEAAVGRKQARIVAIQRIFGIPRAALPFDRPPWLVFLVPVLLLGGILLVLYLLLRLVGRL